MSHHWNETPGESQSQLATLFPPTEESRAIADRIAALKAGLTPTTDTPDVPERFPHGKIGPRDKGQFRYTITGNPTAQIVRVDFGAQVTAIGLTPDEAQQMVDDLKAALWELRGIKAEPTQ